LTFFRTREHRLVVTLVVSIFALMTIVRLAHVLITGFMVADEGLYMYSAILSAEKGSIVISYPNRLLYTLFLSVFGILFNLDTIYKVQVFASVFNFIWTAGCIIMFYKVAEMCFPKNENIHLFVLTLSTLSMMAIANVAYLTEVMALFFLLVGVYFTCKLISQPSHKWLAVFGGFFSGLPFFVREPYGVVSLGIVAYMLFLVFRRKVPLVTGVIFVLSVAVVFRVPIQSIGFNFSNYVIVEVAKIISGVIETFSNFKIDTSWCNAPPRDTFSGGYVTPSLEPYEQKPMDIQVWYDHGEVLRYNRFMDSRRIYYAIVYMVVGLFLGTNPIVFILIFIGLIKLVKQWKTITEEQRLLTIFSVLAIGTVFGSGFLTGIPSPQMVAFGLGYPWGTMARLSHTGILAVFLIVPVLGNKKIVPTKRKMVLSTIILLLLALFDRVVIFSFERQFSSAYVNRVSFDYRPPHIQVSNYARNSGKTLLFGGTNIVLLSLYTRTLPNVFMAALPKNETEFMKLLEADEWDTVLFHGLTHHTVDPTLIEVYPFMWDLLCNETAYSYDIIWDDGESYLYKLHYNSTSRMDVNK